MLYVRHGKAKKGSPPKRRQAADYHKHALRPFLTWAINARHMPKLPLPTLHTRTGEHLTQPRRLTLLRRVLTDDQPPVRSGVS
ncbi:MAG: hypothetical protein JO287_03300 [Pseudonocardiales bacterium]|nr:hypothetical protein [Pseudonocardiales bacterium]